MPGPGSSSPLHGTVLFVHPLVIQYPSSLTEGLTHDTATAKASSIWGYLVPANVRHSSLGSPVQARLFTQME